MNLLVKYYEWKVDFYIKFVHKIDKPRLFNALKKLDNYEKEKNTCLFWQEVLALLKAGRKIRNY